MYKGRYELLLMRIYLKCLGMDYLVAKIKQAIIHSVFPVRRSADPVQEDVTGTTFDTEKVYLVQE